jgi:hypothetical protein
MLVIFGVGVPISIIHELGHGLICQLNGNQFEFQLTAFGGIGSCYGSLANPVLFLAMGGGFGAITAGSIAVLVRRHAGLLIGMITIAVGHLFNMVLETIAYQFYIQGYGSLIATQVLVTGCLVRIDSVSHPKTSWKCFCQGVLNTFFYQVHGIHIYK